MDYSDNAEIVTLLLDRKSAGDYEEAPGSDLLLQPLAAARLILRRPRKFLPTTRHIPPPAVREGGEKGQECKMSEKCVLICIYPFMFGRSFSSKCCCTWRKALRGLDMGDTPSIILALAKTKTKTKTKAAQTDTESV